MSALGGGPGDRFLKLHLGSQRLGQGFRALNFAIALVVPGQQVTGSCGKYVLDGDTYE